VCGIFVLHAEGIELSRNRVIDNGPSTPQHVTYNTPRGGIWLASVTPLTEKYLPPSRIAGAIRENEVRAPNGPALSMGSLGHVQIIANALACTDPDPISAFCAVSLASYGIAPGFQTSVPTLGGLKNGLIGPVKAAMRVMLANKPVAADRVLTAEELGSVKIKINPGNFGIGPINLPPPSSVMFAENHVMLLSPTKSIVGAVEINSIADVQVTGNHFHTAISGTAWVPVFITGATVRIEHNKFTDQVSTLWSMVSNATFGVCMGNVADHCLYVVGAHVINQQNWELDGSACGYMKALPQLIGLSTSLEAQP
jgi:hypothetical protein